jgi:hypothetical protein
VSFDFVVIPRSSSSVSLLAPGDLALDDERRHVMLLGVGCVDAHDRTVRKAVRHPQNCRNALPGMPHRRAGLPSSRAAWTAEC